MAITISPAAIVHAAIHSGPARLHMSIPIPAGGMQASAVAHGATTPIGTALVEAAKKE